MVYCCVELSSYCEMLSGKLVMEFDLYYPTIWARLGAVGLSTALQTQGHGFDSPWCDWNFSFTSYFRLHHGPGVNSASNRIECQEYFLGSRDVWYAGLTNLPPSCADCHKIWKPQGL
jgi:hypothetical protein